MGLVADWFSDLADQTMRWLIETTAAQITVVIGWILDSPDGTLDAPAMRGMIGQGVSVGRYLLPLMLLLGAIQAAAANRPGLLARLAFIELPLTAALMVFIAPATGVLMAAADALTDWVVNESAVLALQSAFEGLPTSAIILGPQAPMVGVLALVALIGAMLVWAMMLMRGLGVALSVVIGPGMIATRMWPAAQTWAARWLSLLVALILVKPVIGFMLSLSMVVMGAGIDPSAGFVDVQALAMGLLAFVASALVPSFLFKFVPQVGDAVQGRLSSGLAGTTLTVASVAISAGYATGAIGAGARAVGSVPLSSAAQATPPATPPPTPPPPLPPPRGGTP